MREYSVQKYIFMREYSVQKYIFMRECPKKDDIFNVFYYTQIKDKGSSTDFCA